MLERLVSHIRELVSDLVKEAINPLASYLRMLVKGVAVASISIGLFFLALVFAGGGLFFYLSEYHKLSSAALWTAGAYLFVFIVLFTISYVNIRKPRP